jgi:TP901 family phage tail tape measure protein
MADTKVGTGYIEIRADFSKIKEDLNRFAKYLRSKNFKGLEQLQARMGEFGDESKKSLDKTKKGFLESWKASISLERTMKRLAFLATVGIAYSAWRYLSNSIREASDEAMEFEQGMYHVLTVMDSGKDVLNKFSKSVESLAIAYGKSTKDLSETLYDIISARIPEEHAISALNKITELAFGNMAELRDVGSAVLAIINSYNMEMSQAGYVTDILQKAIKMGRMELSDFAKTLGRVIPQAANYGVSLEETLGVLSTMTNQGTNARESVTSLNRAISMWAERSETAGILAKEGIFGVVEQMVFLDKQQRKTLSGGVRGVKSLNAVMNNYAQAVINTKEVVENVGAAQEASNKMQMSLMTQLNQAIEKNKKSWRGAGEIWTEWRIVFTHISAAIGEMFKYILIIPGFFAKIFKGNKKTSEQAKAISDNQKAALEYLKEQGYQINWNNGLLEILNKTNEEITNQDAVRFNHLKSQAETIHSQIAAYSKEIKNLQFQYKRKLWKI